MIKEIIEQAEERERKYDWLGAADFYEKVIGQTSEQDFSSRGKIAELLGYALYRASMQSANPDECKERIRRAISHYEAAKTWHEKSIGPDVEARAARCGALVANLSYWLASSHTERKKLLDESWRLAKKAFDAFLSSQEPRECARTFNQLSFGAFLGGLLEWQPVLQEQRFREVIELGERSINLLSPNDDATSSAEALVRTGNCLSYYNYLYADLPERERNHQRIREYWSRARQLSEGTALLATLSFPSLGYWSQGKERKEALEHFGEALRYAEETRDNLLIGFAYDWLCYHSYWSGSVRDNSEERRELAEKTLKYAERARDAFARISFTTPREWVAWVEEPHADVYWLLTLNETDLTKKREILQEASKIAPVALDKAAASGYESVVLWAHHTFSKILADLANLESSSELKRNLLEKALEHRVETIRLSTPRQKFDYWTQGLQLNYLANIRTQLASLTEDAVMRERLYREALETKEAALKLLDKEMQFRERIGTISPFMVLAYGQLEYGELLSSLGKSTQDQRLLKKATEALQHASVYYQKLNKPGRMAECHWRAAQIHDDLGEYHESAGSFASASSCYESAAKEIPQLNSFYIDYAAYMQAWSEVENARYYHSRQNYREAAEHYETAASLHRSTDHWKYLTPNYSAWAHIERGEDLSRKEQGQEAIQAFQEGARLFLGSKKAIQAEQSRIERSEERQAAIEIAGATELRQEYSKARVLLEEAKMLDKKGEHSASSEKYGSASEALEKIIESLKTQQDQREIKLIMILSKAWQTMARSEAEALPELYLEAAGLFEQAKELSPNETSKMLAAGHSRFCKALEAGTRFSDTGEETQHAAATQNLEIAARYYLKAGFKHASEYAYASKLLFDAYAYMNSASKESDQEKRARFYLLAEKMLQASAESYMAAEQQGKKEEVLKLLEKVKKEKDLAVSLTEVLRAPTLLSTAAVFTTPTSTHEKAVGLERFESAEIQGRMILHQKDLKVGELLEFEIELVNAGRGPAQLIKIENLLPQGFDLIEKPDAYRLEEDFLNLKGKRLDELKIEEIRLGLRPRKPGTFALTPRVQYADEAGKHKLQDLEAVEIHVKELGVSGWIKGSGR